MTEIDCTVIGDALIDILLPIEGIGDISRLRDGGVVNTKAQFVPGGIANIAYYLHEHGGNAGVICKVGNDPMGKLYADDLEKNGLKGCVSVSEAENTGMAFVLILENGERFFIDDRGANPSLRYEDYDLGLIRDSKYLFFNGYSFQDEYFSQDILRLLEEIHDHTSVVFNPGAPNLAETYREMFTGIIRNHADILILNEAEARNLTALSEREAIQDSLLEITDTIALTLGSDGSIIANSHERVNLPAMAADVVDTTGAGDAYAGALLYGLSHGLTLRETGELACKAAGHVVSCRGARVPLAEIISRGRIK